MRTLRGATAIEGNTYRVVAVVKAGVGNETTMTYQPVVVSVNNIEEPGEITLSALQPKEDVMITATLKDPDGVPEGATVDTSDASNLTDVQVNDQPLVTWQWATSTSETGPWNDVDGQTSKTYEPTESDAGLYLQVRATYSDGHGVDDPYTEDVDESEDAAVFTTTHDVLQEDYVNLAPEFPDQDPDTTGIQNTVARRTVDENSSVRTVVGDPIYSDRPWSRQQPGSTYLFAKWRRGWALYGRRQH